MSPVVISEVILSYSDLFKLENILLTPPGSETGTFGSLVRLANHWTTGEVAIHGADIVIHSVIYS